MSVADGKHAIGSGTMLFRFSSPADRKRLRRVTEAATHNQRVALVRRQAIAIQEIIEARENATDSWKCNNCSGLVTEPQTVLCPNCSAIYHEPCLPVLCYGCGYKLRDDPTEGKH